jgi:RNA polymerase sigma factor (sigma-70 family)
VAASAFHRVVQHLRETVLRDACAGLTDAQLLETFLADREPAGLEILVQRHAPMVWSVCRRIVLNHHDAEDAFQATFLVLVRRAATVRPGQVANWLYGVARQTALKARASAARRRGKEKQLTSLPEPATRENRRADLLFRLDEELSRLPDKYRTALVLCDLEGQTRKEAAQQLGVPEGTLAARLVRARALLCRRLARHAPAVTAAGLATLLAEQTAPAAVPTSLLQATVSAATSVAAKQVTAAAAISASVAALTEGVLFSMTMTKVKTATGLLFVCLLGAGLGATTLAGQDQPASAQAAPERRVEQTTPGLEGGDPRSADKNAPERRVRDLERQILQLTQELQALKAATAHQPPTRREVEVQITALRHMPASEAAKVLTELFSMGAQRIVAFPSTNSVVVQGTPGEIRAIASMLQRLEEHAAKHQDNVRRSGSRPPVGF